jgi:hypothetical protein
VDARLETGQRGTSPRDIRDLCDLYSVTDPADRERLMTLARAGKRQAWWHSKDLHSQTYVGLEEDAVSIRQYNSNVVPGLLQTADYARALTTAVLPRLSAEAVTNEVDARLTRQQLLIRADSPQLVVVLDESVLRRVVGSAAIMRAQMKKLLEVSSLPNVSLRVLPYDAGALPAVETRFIILGIAAPAISDVVFVEGILGDTYIERRPTSSDNERYLRSCWTWRCPWTKPTT